MNDIEPTHLQCGDTAAAPNAVDNKISKQLSQYEEQNMTDHRIAVPSYNDFEGKLTGCLQYVFIYRSIPVLMRRFGRI